MKDLRAELVKTEWDGVFAGDEKRKYAVTVRRGIEDGDNFKTTRMSKEVRVVAPSALAWTLASMCAGKVRVSDDDAETWILEPTAADSGLVWRKDGFGTSVVGRYSFAECQDAAKEPGTLERGGWLGLGAWVVRGGPGREYTAFGNGYIVGFSTREMAREWADERNVELTEVQP